MRETRNKTNINLNKIEVHAVRMVLLYEVITNAVFSVLFCEVLLALVYMIQGGLLPCLLSS